jgi:hypothetical protein
MMAASAWCGRELMAAPIPLQRLAARHFADLLRLFADCVHVGFWRDSSGADTTNVPFLFAGLPAFGIETSGITRSDVCAYVSTCYIPASYRLGGTEHVWYYPGGGPQEVYFNVICGAADPTGSFWCLFLRPAYAPK